MPVIPGQDEARGIFPEAAPIVDVGARSFGRDAQALSELGGAIADVGAEVFKRRVQSIEADAEFRQLSDDQIWLAETLEKERLSFGRVDPADPSKVEITDYRGFSNRIKELTDERLRDGLSSMPTQTSKLKYQQKAGSFFNDTYVKNLAWENITNAKIRLENLDKEFTKQNLFLFNRPTLDNWQGNMNNFIARINDGVGVDWSAQDASRLINDFGRRSAVTMFDGMMATKEGQTQLRGLIKNVDRARLATGPVTGVDVTGKPIKEGEAAGVLFSKINFSSGKTLDPMLGFLREEDIVRYAKQLETAESATVRLEAREISENLKSINAAAIAGREDIVRQDIPEVGRMIGRLVDLSKEPDKTGVTPTAVNKEILEVSASVAAGRIIGKLPYISDKDAYIEQFRSEFEAARSGLPAPVKTKAFGQEFAIALEQKAEYAWNDLLRQRNADPVGYIQKHGVHAKLGAGDISIENPGRYATLLALQDQLGVAPDSQRLLSKAEENSIISQVQQTNDPRAKAEILGRLKANSGQHFNRIMKEITGRDKLPEGYLQAFSFGDDRTAESMINAIDGGREIDDALAAAGRKDDKKTAEEAVQVSFQKYFQSIAGTSPAAFNQQVATNFSKMITTVTKQKLVQDPQANVSETAASVVKDVMDRHFDVRQNVLIPRTVNNVSVNMEAVDAEMKQVHKSEWLNSADVLIPGSAANARDRFKLALESSRWVHDADLTGARLQIKDTEGRWINVRKKDGTPVRIDFIQSTLNTSPQALSEIKPPLSGLGESVVKGLSKAKQDQREKSAKKLGIKPEQLDAIDQFTVPEGQ